MPDASILVVEDDGIIAKDIADKLHHLGYTVCGSAERGEQAISLAHELRPALVLMDIHLKGSMDGIDAAEQIRRDCDIPVIFLTALSDRATLERSKLSEPFGYLLKPFEERDLDTHIEMALYRHQSDRKLRESEQRWRVTLGSIGDAVIATDTDGSVTFLNPVAATLTGWTPDEASGQPITRVFNIINEQTNEPAENLVERVLRENRSLELANHTALVTRDGRVVPVEDSAAPISDAAGRITGVVIVFHDVTAKRRAEDALRESEEHFRLALKNSPVSVAMQDRNLVYQWAVDQQSRQPDEIIGKTDADLFAAEDALWIIEAKRRVLTTGQEVHLANWVTRNGRRMFLDLHFEPTRDLAGEITGIGIATVDLTAQKLASEASQKQEALLRAVLEQMPSGVTARDAKTGDLIISNAQARRLMGPLVVRIDDYSAYKASYPDGRALSTEDWPLARAATSGEVITGEDIIYHHPDGNEITLRTSAVPIRDSEGQLVAAVALFDDVSERQRAEQALIESERRYRTLFDSLQEGFYLAQTLFAEDGTPCDFTYLDTNPAFERIMGLPREQIVGHSARELIPALNPEWVQIFSRVELTGVPAKYDNYSDPFKKYFETFVFRPVPGEFAVLVTDITHRKQAEEALRVSLHEKEALLKEIHHRVKNNMQIISSLVSLQAQTLGTPELRAQFDDLRDRVRTMALVHEKLYQTENLASVDFAEYIRSLLNYLWRAHSDLTANVRLALELHSISLSVEKAVPCGLILNELVTNALKHAFLDREQGTLYVQLHAGDDGHVSLRVSDDGVGLPAALDWRQSPSLGLKLIQVLATQLDGTLEVSSSGGTTFHITFTSPGN